MRWWTFILLGVLTLTLQTSLAPRLSIFGVRPDWLLVMVVFFAMHGRRSEAIVAGWSVGLCADLMSLERFGLLALSYALIAWLVSSIRDFLFRRQAVTQFVVTFLASVCLQIGWLIYRRALYSFADSPWTDLALSLLLTTVYTAVWAPPVHRVLLSVGPWLGLPRPAQRFGAMSVSGASRV